MKKIIFLAITSLTLAACSTTKLEEGNQTSETTVEQTTASEVTTIAKSEKSLTIKITEDGKEIENGTKTIEFEEGAKLLDVMKKNFEVEETDGFINSINGIKQDEANKKYWMFDVNGEMSEKGANDLELKAGDLVEWKLEALK